MLVRLDLVHRWGLGVVMAAVVAAAGSFPVHAQSDSPPCLLSWFDVRYTCYSPQQQLSAEGLVRPATIDPVPIVSALTSLPLAQVVTFYNAVGFTARSARHQRVSGIAYLFGNWIDRPGVIPLHAGPPTYLYVAESGRLLPSNRITVSRIVIRNYDHGTQLPDTYGPAQFSANVPGYHLSLFVEADSTKAVVKRVGLALLRGPAWTARRLRPAE